MPPRQKQQRSAIQEIADLDDDVDVEEQNEEYEEGQGEQPDHTLSELFIGEDSVEIRISQVVTVAGKDHFVGTNTNLRAMPGENGYELAERVAGLALETNFAVAEQYRDMKVAEIQARKRQSSPTTTEK